MVSLGMNSAAQGRASALLSTQQAGNGSASLQASASTRSQSAISINATTNGATSAARTAQGAAGNASTTSVGASASSQISQQLHLTVNGGDVVNDASRRMNRDALIVFAMLGVPPEQARKMAEDLSGTADAVVNHQGFNAALRNAAQGTGGFSLVASSVELQVSQTDIQASSSNGGVTRISVSDFQMRVSQIRMEIGNVTQQDPLILDLDGNGIDITSLRDGAVFDLDGNGTKDRVAWVAGNDALLALDKNKNGQIDDGTELFGDQNGAKDGFAELATYDDNGDGTIDAQDKVFSSLILLHADGSQSSLSDEGIASIRVSAITPLSERLVGGTLAAEGEFVRDDGSVGKTGEVLLDMQA
ncbi:hypothetical protein [Thalassospira marina]|uniref:EF-hand domain-containing protein n=1 Tax=Thalassospira marina TaxID=2048283 RepID=A0A2N3KUA6_9PROT|nr:hypothetical protein [Thalassospira marina]PKR54169.1 hypothetical protein COO20_11610 [Thalassospira marina]